MVWRLSQGVIPTGVAQVTTPKMVGDLDMVSGLWEYITSVRHGYIQVGISYWAAAMVLVSDR